MSFECVSRSDVGLRRKVNEDSILVRTERGLWAVADGMGGHDAGDVASAMVAEALQRLPIIYGLEQLVDAAIEELRQVNRRLIDLARSGGHERTIGTTVVALAIADGHFHCFWAGDSRAYRVRDGAIRRISRDHSLVQDLVDAGMLAANEAEGHVNANVITRAVGVAEVLDVDSSTGDALSGDLFLLASDGLTRVVDDQEILAQLAAKSPDDAADALVDMVLARGAPDNVSLIITRVV
ncbi:MAG TPA: protein phosphatase 2C domain-containing protein [Sphingomicrobium sp.]|jgi:serine/threonine protein phosphatase PrpC|nr:protein phosphatase 2C domain-containing protein [Sphingomicrobium sp.]